MGQNKTNGTLKNSKINVKSPEVQKILAKVLESSYRPRQLKSALEKIDAKNHQKELMDFVERYGKWYGTDHQIHGMRDIEVEMILEIALNKVKDQDFLIKFVKSYRDGEFMHNVRISALRKIKDQLLLSRFAVETTFRNEALFALSKIRDPELLYDVVSKSINPIVCI